jgi:hypothetical protein
MTAAAIATTATVEAARSIRPIISLRFSRKTPLLVDRPGSALQWEDDGSPTQGRRRYAEPPPGGQDSAGEEGHEDRFASEGRGYGRLSQDRQAQVATSDKSRFRVRPCLHNNNLIRPSIWRRGSAHWRGSSNIGRRTPAARSAVRTTGQLAIRSSCRFAVVRRDFGKCHRGTSAHTSSLPSNAVFAFTPSSSTRSSPGSCLGVSDVRATRRTEALDKRRPGGLSTCLCLRPRECVSLYGVTN